jgi:hypothetical protein
LVANSIRVAERAGTRESLLRFDTMRACRFRTSSMIDRAAYDDEAKSLCLSFRETGKYVYFDVPASLFDSLCKSASVGNFFNAQIKGRFRCQRDPDRRRFGPNS